MALIPLDCDVNPQNSPLAPQTKNPSPLAPQRTATNGMTPIQGVRGREGSQNINIIES